MDAPELNDKGFARRVETELYALGYPETHILRRKAVEIRDRADLRPKVKALVWEGFVPALIAYTILGDYHISGFNGPWVLSFEDECPYLEGRAFETLEAAKAAAQGDYERRILAELEE